MIEAIAAKRTIFIPEGEKDCDALAKLGLAASCNAGGASEDGNRPKWTAKHAAFFAGADVVILPDNDDPGRAHGEAIAKSLQGIAARVRMLDLPGLKDKGDVSDWLAKGGDAPQLMALAESAPDWTDSGTSGGTGALPEFRAPITVGELAPIMELLDDVLLTNEPEPPMRSLTGWPVEVELQEPTGFHELTASGSNDDEAAQSRLPPPKTYMLASHNACTLALLIERYARFWAKNKQGDKYYKRLDSAFIKHFLEFKKSKLPRVGALMTMPIVLPERQALGQERP